ncbi:MAG: hypothetical protein ACLQBK_02720 [Candidatus Sulfotelmatobacter sp.]
MPESETVATAVGAALHVALAVTSLVVESLYVQIAASCIVSPTSNDSPGAETLTDCGVGGGGGGTTVEEPPPPQPVKAIAAKTMPTKQNRRRSTGTKRKKARLKTLFMKAQIEGADRLRDKQIILNGWGAASGG